MKGALKSGAGDLAYTAGERAARMQVAFMSLPAEQQGEMAGKMIGYLIPEILTSVISYGIVAGIKAGVPALKAIRATKVVTKVFEAARAVVRAFDKVVQVIKGAGPKFKKLGEMLDKVMDYFRGLVKAEKEIWEKMPARSGSHIESYQKLIEAKLSEPFKQWNLDKANAKASSSVNAKALSSVNELISGLSHEFDLGKIMLNKPKKPK